MRGHRRAGWLLAGPVMAILIVGCTSGPAATPADAPASTEFVSQTPTPTTMPSPTAAPTRTVTATPRLATTAAPTPSTTPCARGEVCGTWSGEGTNVKTGTPAGCSGTLTFLDAVVLREQSDVMGGRLHFSFKETVLDDYGVGCASAKDFLELAADGKSVHYRARFLFSAWDEFISEGTLYLVEP